MGHVQKLVPDSLTLDIDQAWSILDKAYGDPTRLLKSRIEALTKMESLPKENNKKGIKGQVEWYIELESLMQSLLVLDQSQQKLGMTVFQSLFINDIYNLRVLQKKPLRCINHNFATLWRAFTIWDRKYECQNMNF